MRRNNPFIKFLKNLRFWLLTRIHLWVWNGLQAGNGPDLEDATVTITDASALIDQAHANGLISREDASRAHHAIRQAMHYGMRMTARDRASILRNRFGIEG